MQHLTLLLALAGSALSTPLTSPSSKTLPQNYLWSAQNWNAQGVRAGVSYDFNVTGPLDESWPLPSFTAYCTGFDTGEFNPCKVLQSDTLSGKTSIPDVLALLVPSNGNGTALVSVSLLFDDEKAGVSYNITGNGATFVNAFVAPPQNFTITPRHVISVA